MTDQHPITPPPQLVAHWLSILQGYTEAARWGADQELEASCKWLEDHQNPRWAFALRAARRPKPPSPKEEALQVLEALIESRRIVDPEYQALRHALEQLDD